jgi:peptide/nickel transport system substrate-binding protein
MKRREVFRAGAGLAGAVMLGAPAIVAAQGARVLKFVPQSNLGAIDPVWTTAYVTRNHALIMFDTLWGLDDSLTPQPQMVEGALLENDGRKWLIALRQGLKWHDGAPVRAADAVASIKRWAKRDAMGSRILALSDDGARIRALDDRRFEIVLEKPFPLLPWALGKPSTPMCAIMPERIAATDPFTQIKVEDLVGSGPFRFKRDEFVSGSRVVYERFDGYLPRDEPAQHMAGGKVAHFDRIEWHIMPDQATASAALQTGEIDWWENPTADLLAPLRRNRNIVVDQVEQLGNIAIIRMNHLHPPFNNPAIRRAVLPAVDQAATMTAVVGTDTALWADKVGIFTPGTPFATDAGMEVLTGPRSVDAARRALEAAGYKGEKVVLIAATDFPVLKAMADVCHDMYRRIGLNVEYVATDWGTVLQRRASREPVERGGWSTFCTSWNGADMLNPAGHLSLRGNGEQGWFGWASSPRIEALRDAWFEAPNLDAQKKLCAEMQLQAFQDVPYIPTGQFLQFGAYRRSITGIVKGVPQIFWGVRRA